MCSIVSQYFNSFLLRCFLISLYITVTGFTQLIFIYICFSVYHFLSYSFLCLELSLWNHFPSAWSISFRVCFYEVLRVINSLSFSLSSVLLFAIFFPLTAFKILISPLNFDSFTIISVGMDLSLFKWPTHFWVS